MGQDRQEAGLRAGWSAALARFLGAVVAAVAAFALAAAFMRLTVGAFEGWASLGVFAAVPAALLALLPAGARMFCFVLGMLALPATLFFEFSGPDNPLIILPWVAICLAGAALVAELCVRLFAPRFQPDAICG